MAISPLVQQAQQTSTGWSSGNEQNDLLQQNLRGAGSGGYDTYGASPSYAPQGVMPKRDFGFEEYLGHHLNSATWAPDGKARGGPYEGLNRAQLEEKARDDYAGMSPEERQPWESRVHLENDRSAGDNATQGFQYQDQKDQWGNKSPMLNPISGAPNYQQQDTDRDRLISAGKLRADQTISDPTKFQAAVASLDQRTVSLGGSSGVGASVRPDGSSRPLATSFQAPALSAPGVSPTPSFLGPVSSAPPSNTSPVTRPTAASPVYTPPSVVPHPDLQISSPATQGGTINGMPAYQAIDALRAQNGYRPLDRSAAPNYATQTVSSSSPMAVPPPSATAPVRS